MANEMEVAAIYFPSWHRNPHYEAWYGSGFTEWELVKSARPLYPGHHQPKQPLWGYFDESDPSWSSREIDLAADHGITAFLFDWYWYSGVRIMEEALEDGFLKAPNRQRLKFAIMWANHNWGPWPAVTGIPGMHSATGISSAWLPIRHSMEDLDRVIDYCCEHYFHEPNYWRIRDCPLFAIYDVPTFVDQLGGKDLARSALERMSTRAQKHGLPGLYYTANVVCGGNNVFCCNWDLAPMLVELGFSSTFAYNIVRTPGYNTLPDERPTVPYEDVMESHKFVWQKLEYDSLSHYPTVTIGCDVTPRWHRGVTLPMDFRALAYEPIIEGNTPENFGTLCHLALKHAQANGSQPKSIIINAWNEWTEGMYLLPEARYGTGYLESLHEALTMFGHDEIPVRK